MGVTILNSITDLFDNPSQAKADHKWHLEPIPTKNIYRLRYWIITDKKTYGRFDGKEGGTIDVSLKAVIDITQYNLDPSMSEEQFKEFDNALSRFLNGDAIIEAEVKMGLATVPLPPQTNPGI